MPGLRKSNGKKKGAGKAAGASSSAGSQSIQESLKPFTHSFAVQEPNAESADAIDDGASDVSLEPIFEGLRNFASATPTSNSFTTPNGSFAVQEPDTEPADEMDDGASDVSLEPMFEGLENFSSATSASNSTFNHPTTTRQSNGNINHTQNMIKQMVSGLPSSLPQVASEDHSFVDYAANLLASIPITAGPQSQTTAATLPAHIVKLIASLPVPPTTPLPPTAAEWQLILRPLIPSFVNNYTSFTDVLKGSSAGSMKKPRKRPSVKSVGKVIKRLVLPAKKNGGEKKEKRKNKKLKLDSEDMDEQALLDLAIEMSLAEDGDDQALLEKVLEESLVDKIMLGSAVDMGVKDQDVTMTEAQYASAKMGEWVSENQVNFGAATSSTLQSHQPVTEASTTAPFDPVHRLRLEQIAKDTLALMEKQEDEFAARMISIIISHTLHQSLTFPTSPATSSTSADNILFHRRPFNFKGLPLDVRNEIYKLLVVMRPAAYATTSPRTRRQLRLEPHIPSGDTAIFFTNKQISEESRAVFYTFNVFTIGNGRHGASDHANLHGLEEFAKMVPRRFRRMIRNVEMEIVLPMGWLNEKRSGLDRDREERHVQTKLLGLGKLLRRKFRGVENVRAEFRTDGSLWGGLQAWHEGLPFEIEVSKEEKLNALRGLIQLPGLHTVRVGDIGPMSVNSAFMGIAQEIVDENDAAGSGPEERERGTVMQVAEMVDDEVMGGETTEEGGMVVDAEIKGDIGAWLYDDSEEGEHVEGGLHDEGWENPFAVEGDQTQIELLDNDTLMDNSQTEEESVMACFGIEG